MNRSLFLNKGSFFFLSQKVRTFGFSAGALNTVVIVRQHETSDVHESFTLSFETSERVFP